MTTDTWDEIADAIRTNLATIWKHNGPTLDETKRLAAKYRVNIGDVWRMANSAYKYDQYPRPKPSTGADKLAAARQLADAAKPDPLACPHCDYRAKKPRGLAIHIGRDHESPAAKHPVPGVTMTPADLPEPQQPRSVDPTPDTTPGPEPAAGPGQDAALPTVTVGGLEIELVPGVPLTPNQPDVDPSEPEDARLLCDAALAAVSGIIAATDDDTIEGQARRAIAELTQLQDLIRDSDRRAALLAEHAILLARIAEIEQALAPAGPDEGEVAA